MRRPLTKLVLTLAFVLAGLTHALAEKRVALVIGNAAYEHTSVLKTPLNDTREIVEALKALDFEVVEGRDLDIDAMKETVTSFRNALDGAEVALLYYAGHGIQVGGKNYLLPISAKLESELDLSFGTVALDNVLKIMSADDRIALAFLDAAHENPMAVALSKALASQSGVRSVATPQVGNGLAAVEATVGTLVSFSIRPGEVAPDAAGPDGPYAQAIVKHIATPGQTVDAMMTKVRADVLAATDGRQRTWEHSWLTGRFFFKKAEPVAATTAEAKVAAAAPAGAEAKADPQPKETAGAAGDTEATVKLQLEAYREADKIGTCNAYRAFVETYPDSAQAKLARDRAAQVCKDDNAKTASAETTPADTTAPAKTETAAAIRQTRQVVIEPAEKAEPKTAVIVAPKPETPKADKAAKVEAKPETEQAPAIVKRQIAVEPPKTDEPEKVAAAEVKPETTAEAKTAPAVKKRQIVVEPTEANAEKADETAEATAKEEKADPVVTGATPAKKEAKAEPVKVAKAEAEEQPAEKVEEAETADAIDEKALVLALQTELERVGCSPGKLDGLWGRRSRAALEAFAHHGKIKLKSAAPTAETLDLVKGKAKRICPVSCGAGEIYHRGTCVAYDCPPGARYAADGGCVPYGYSTRQRYSPGYGGYRRGYGYPRDHYRGRGGYGRGGYGGGGYGGGYRY